MLINLSNHPSSLWGKEQIESAICLFGDILDIPFPMVDPNGDKQYIESLAEKYVDEMTKKADRDNTVIHIMGELTLTFAILNKMINLGFRCVASTTERDATISEDGTKNVKFNFIQFRDY